MQNQTNSITSDVAIVVRLPQELREDLKARAAAEDRSVASLLRLAARQYLARGHQCDE